jgi:large subunit ribosomal protein L3
MTQIFSEEGNVVPVTIVKIEPNIVVGIRNAEKNGYNATVLGAFDAKKSRVKKPIEGQYAENMVPKKVLKEFRDYEHNCSVGDKVGVEIFEGIQYLDIKGISKGKGFQGVIKRHGFKGGRKTHGSKFHRAPGSTGMNTLPARVIKGKKMPGHMGHEQVTVQNLQLIKIDKENNLILIKGSVPGPSDNMVIIVKSKKKTQKK